MINQSQTFTAQSALEIVSRHRKKLILCPLLVVLAGVLFFIFCPRTYRSEARLFLRLGRESVGIDPTATTGQTMPLYTADRKDEVKSAEEVFKSRSVVAQAVDQLGPDVVLGRSAAAGKSNTVASTISKPIRILVNMMKSLDPISEREEAIITVERNLSVGAERQATVIVVQYQAQSPQLAQTICQAIVNAGRQEHMRAHRNEESRLFFSKQQERLREQLDQALDALRNAKNEMGLVDVEQRRQTLEAQYGAIALDRLSTNQKLATAQASIDDLKRQLAEIPERLVASKRSIPNEGADLLQDRFFELQVKSMDLRARYSDTHPLVVAVNDQLDEARKVLAEQAEQRMETTDDLNPIHRELSLEMKQQQSTVAGLKARLIELDEQKKFVLADLRALNQSELDLDRLGRDSDLARSKYEQYARNMEEALIDKELENQNISNIGEVQAATLAEKPVAPPRMLTVVGTFVLATVGTFALVVFAERQNAPPPALNGHTMVRRIPRRRVRGDLASKTNGQSKTEVLHSPAK
jgi:uncharacterized protein involved in exopolysaccharide biosynthesis